MALADDLQQLTPKNGSKTCSIKAMFGQLSDKDRSALVSILLNERILHSDIAQTLKDNGFDISAQTVARHRRKQCRCEQ